MKNRHITFAESHRLMMAVVPLIKNRRLTEDEYYEIIKICGKAIDREAKKTPYET